jgi:hypothetical protein
MGEVLSATVSAWNVVYWVGFEPEDREVTPEVERDVRQFLGTEGVDLGVLFCTCGECGKSDIDTEMLTRLEAGETVLCRGQVLRQD